MHATGFTMVKPKRPGGNFPSPLKPVIGAFLDLPLGPGFAAFPDLIDKDSVEKSILQLRQTFYFEALKVVTKSDWNRYIHFGFQQFANPLDYLKCVDQETEAEADIRIFRYFCLHEEADASINKYLCRAACHIRNDFLKTRPSLLKMSVREIDEYVTNGLAAPVAPAPSPQSIVKPVAATDDDKNSNVEMIDNDGDNDNEVNETGAKTATIEPVKETPSRSSSVIRIIARWSPKDFNTLNKSRDDFNSRIAKILSAVHTSEHPLVEWQTSQVSSAADILPADVSKFLSIKIASSYKTKTFTFGFRICTTGTTLKTILQSKALASVKKGEALHFEPSTVPVTQGDIVHVGDILLKDATVTHRAHYKSFLSKCKLPADMPEFDIKLRHKDPLGVKAPILIIRCGTTVATKVAEIFCQTLNGQGDSKEIFISKLGLGASKISRETLTSLYGKHHSFVRDSVHLQFKTARNIDSIRTEYFDDGTTCERSPRNWARSLTLDDQHQGIDLANGAADGLAVLIAPGDVADFAKEQLRLYELRQYPVLGDATNFYETSTIDPSIPETVFTTNIAFLLSRETKVGSKKTKPTPTPNNAWTKRMEKQKKKTVTVSPTSPDTSSVTSLQQKNEMLQARINALEKETKASTSSQSSMTSDSTESTTAEDMTLTLESVQTICERMFSDRMLQIERKIQLMFEKLLNKQGSTADVVTDPATETTSKLATVENGLVVLQEMPNTTSKKRQKCTAQPTPAPHTIDPNTPQYKAMETDDP